MAVKSLAQEQFEEKHAYEMELATRELKRRSFDVIRVYNPLDHTFSFMYDRFWHRIPAKTYKDLPRYLAMHFFKKICDDMIGAQIMKKGEELKKLREAQLGQPFLDHYEENVQIWDRTPKLNDPDLIEQIKKVVLIGLVEEYGMEEPEPETREPEKPTDFRPLHEQIFSSIDKIPVLIEQSQASIQPVETVAHPNVAIETPPINPQDLAEEVMQND